MSGYTLKSRTTQNGTKLVLSRDTTWRSEARLLMRSVSNESLFSRTNPGPPFIAPSDFYHTEAKIEVAPFVVETRVHKVNGGDEIIKRSYGVVPSDLIDSRYYSQDGWSYTDYYLKPGSADNLRLSDDVMLQYGLKGLNRMNPLKPKASMAQSIVELKRDMPRLTFSVIKRLLEARKVLNKRTLKAGSSDYLNFQFGITPLISDIRAILNAAVTAQKDWNRFIKLNGKWVSRKTTLYRNTDTQVISSNSSVPYSCVAFGSGSQTNGIEFDTSQGTISERTITTDEVVYATCQYRYYYPEIEKNGAQRALYEMNRLGLDFNPSLLWELMPWSFLIDWFVNCGELIEFWTNKANDSLMYRNLAVMASKTITVRCQTNLIGVTEIWDSIPGYGVPHPRKVIRGSSSATYTRGVKQRYVGTDFGFGISPGSLNGFQLSILAALGINALK